MYEAIEALFAALHIDWDLSFLWNLLGNPAPEAPAPAPVEGGGPDMCPLMHGVVCTPELNR